MGKVREDEAVITKIEKRGRGKGNCYFLFWFMSSPILEIKFSVTDINWMPSTQGSKDISASTFLELNRPDTMTDCPAFFPSRILSHDVV